MFLLTAVGGLGSSFSINTRLHRDHYLEIKYLFGIQASVWHRHTVVKWRLNNIIHQEHGVAQLLVKSRWSPDKHEAFWLAVMKCRGVIEPRCWASSCFCCESVAYLTGQSLQKSGCHSLLCGGEGLQWDTGLFCFCLYLNVSWQLSFGDSNG